MSEHTHLLYNAKIYAGGEAAGGQDDFSWLLFDSGSGLVTGRGRGEPPTLPTAPSRRLDAGGRRVLPGLHEAHIHVAALGMSLAALSLKECGSIAELQAALRERAEQHPGDSWVVGLGWTQERLGRFPTREDLDAVFPARPVVLYRNCIHVVVVNTEALRLAGFTDTTPDPEGGELGRYPADHPRAGQLDGMLYESARQPITELVAAGRGPDERQAAVKAGLARCLRAGVTAVGTLEEDAWGAYCRLVAAGELQQRVFYAAYFSHRAGGPEVFPPAPGVQCGPLLSCDRVKLFADGALGACTAAMGTPYRGTTNTGTHIHKQENLDKLVAEAVAMGYRLEIHVIGDAAMDSALTALERAEVAPEKRPILVHCQFVRPDLIPRMRALGVVPSIQPQFVPTDTQQALRLIPDTLLQHSYPWRTLIQHGLVCAGGSDAPVESPEPLIGIHDAIFRPDRRADGTERGVFRPEECLTVHEAISLYTTGAAWSARREDSLGQLRPGFQADFILLDSPSDVISNPREFLEATVAQVWVAGLRRL